MPGDQKPLRVTLLHKRVQLSKGLQQVMSSAETAALSCHPVMSQTLTQQK